MSDDQDNVFVNRHGKKMSLDGSPVELPVIDEPIVATKPQAVSKPKKVKKIRNKRPVKKVVLILLIVMLILALIPVIGGELVRARYISSRDAAKAQLIEYGTRIVVPQQKKQVTLVSLGATAGQAEKIRDDACDGGLMDNLAMIYPRAREAFDQCITLKQKVAAIAASLRDMESQVRYLEALAPVVEPVSKGTTDEFAVISAQHENWRALHEAITKLSPAAPQRIAHEKLVSQGKVIADAWSALNTANNNQDATAFADAEKQLGEAYEVFRSSSSSLANILNTTQANLSTNYEAL